jgi:hypothetical protein
VFEMSVKMSENSWCAMWCENVKMSKCQNVKMSKSQICMEKWEKWLFGVFGFLGVFGCFWGFLSFGGF